LPRVEKDYFRDLEASSLTDVQQELRQLAQNVGSLTEGVNGMKAGLDELRRVVYGVLIAVVLTFAGVLMGGIIALAA
jgi:hypothetical protein